MRRDPIRLLLGALAVVVAGVIVAAAPSPTDARQSHVSESACKRYASPNGNDGWKGTRKRPYRTVQRLVNALARGGRACLLRGFYRGNVVIRAGGTQNRPLVLTTVRGRGRAHVNGIVQVNDSASWVVLERLFLDSRNPPLVDGVGIKIFGDHVVLRDSEVTSGGERICVQTGDANGRYGIAWYPLIERNRIHGCGNRGPRGSKSYPSGHAVYMQADRFARVRDNYIYDTNYGGTLGGRGIQLWPDSQDATIEHNVIDNSNAWNVIVSGSRYPTGTTHGAKIRRNVMTNPVEYNLTTTWLGVEPQPGVAVTENCVTPGFRGYFALVTWEGKPSYVEQDNVRADPLYVDREAKDFRLRSGSPCSGMGPRPGRAPG